MSTIPNPNKTRTWDRTTPNDGLLFDGEFTSLYANDNSLQSQIAGLQAQISALANSITQTNIPLGGMIEYDFPNIPQNFAVANGQAISRTTYSSLWALVWRSIGGLVPATGRVQSVAHGLAAGQAVKFSFTGGGITTNTSYFVINPTTNDFQISLTPGGIAISLTSNQTGDLLAHIQYGFGDGSTTFNVPDRRGIFARGAGQHGLRAKAAGGNYDGGVIGQEKQDMFQGHRFLPGAGTLFQYQIPTGGSLAFFGSPGSVQQFLTSSTTGDPTTDGTNGIPRIGNETSPASTTVQYILRVL
ncbi:tail fiber protein [Leptospira fluminis]|uniref:Tail fiber protein n=1 Tax=Leptospira fluminis TaxID=2484979 RepID=A0A4R9GPI1_9LEPT|nr:tail fiber protein [Leptospira fluminis]TGK18030.1 tail fiber protein [Leptospira fluminis]